MSLIPKRARERRLGVALSLSMGLLACGLPGAPSFDPWDNEPPLLVQSIPVKGSVEVPIGVTLQLLFSEPLAEGSLAPDGVTLRSGPASTVLGLGTAGLGPRRLGPGHYALIPAAPLLPGASYRLSFSEGVVDRGLNPLAGERVLRFTTASEPGTLRILSTEPSAGATVAGPRPPLRLHFDGPLSSLGVDRSLFRLEDADGKTTAISVRISEEAELRTLNILPLKDLQPASRYTLIVANTLPDAAGRELESEFQLEFQNE